MKCIFFSVSLPSPGIDCAVVFVAHSFIDSCIHFFISFIH